MDKARVYEAISLLASAIVRASLAKEHFLEIADSRSFCDFGTTYSSDSFRVPGTTFLAIFRSRFTDNVDFDTLIVMVKMYPRSTNSSELTAVKVTNPTGSKPLMIVWPTGRLLQRRYFW